MTTQLLYILVALLLSTSATAQPSPSKESVQAKLPDYLESYLQLKDALFADDIAKTKAAATGMKNKIGAEEVSDSKKLESINTALTTIVSADDIEAQRTAFAKLSQYMVTLLKSNPVPGVTVYSDFCPMARNGKGAYWLSLDKEINNNPYMGARMPHCGTIDEKISK